MDPRDMTKDELIRTMRAALDDEREGLRRLDAAAVTRATRSKESVLQSLMMTVPAERGPLLAALAELHAEMQQNLRLLAHARHWLAEVTVPRRL